MQSSDNKTCHYAFGVNRRTHRDRSRRHKPYRRKTEHGDTYLRKKKKPKRPQKNSKKMRRRESNSRDRPRNTYHRKRPHKPRKRDQKKQTTHIAKKETRHNKKQRKPNPKRKEKGLEYVWVRKSRKPKAPVEPVKTRERGGTFNSAGTKDTTDERIPNVEALTKMLELQKEFEKKRETSEEEAKNDNFEKILDSRYSNSSIKTGSIFSGSELKFDPPTPEKARVKLVVDMSEIRKKLDFDSNSVEEEQSESEARASVAETTEDDEFEFILREIGHEEKALDSGSDEVESGLEDFSDFEFAGDSEKNVDSECEQKEPEERFKLESCIDTRSQLDGPDPDARLEAYCLENTFLCDLFEKQLFLEQNLENYKEEEQARRQFEEGLAPIENLASHLKENDFFSDYLQLKRIEQGQQMGQINKYFNSLSKEALLKRKSFIRSLCAMQKIDSLFATEHHKKHSKGEYPEPVERESREEQRRQKRYKKTIVIKKCPEFFKTGICLKGEHCSKLHISFHSQYRDLRRCVTNMLKAISKKHEGVSLENLLDNFNKMKPALDIFSKIMYRKPEISIFDDIFDEYHQMF